MPELATTRTAVSGGAEGTQLKDELTEIAELERETLLKECLGKEFKIIIPRAGKYPDNESVIRFSLLKYVGHT